MSKFNDLTSIYEKPVLTRRLSEDTALVICYNPVNVGDSIQNSGLHLRSVAEVLGSRLCKGAWPEGRVPMIYRVRME
jgi:hypothetical protein